DTGTGIDDAGFGMRRGDDERPIIRLAADVDDGRAFIDEYFRAARLLLGSNLRPGIHETDGRIVADFEAAGIGEGDDRRAVASGAQTLAILQRLARLSRELALVGHDVNFALHVFELGVRWCFVNLWSGGDSN